MSALQCDVSTPFYLCGVNTIFNPAVEIQSCQERLLIIGQMTAGTATPGVPVQVVGSNEDELFGDDSMVAAMVRVARCTSPFASVDVLPIADFGTKGTAVATFTNAATMTFAETISLMVNGQVYTIAAAPGDTDAMIAAAFAAAMADANLTVSAAGNVLTVETINGGEKGGWIDMRSAYSVLGIRDPEQVDVAITVTQGVGVPGLPTPLSPMTGGAHTFIANPYCDLVSMTAVKDFICSSWAPRSRVRSESFTVTSDDQIAATGVAAAMNAPQIHYGPIIGQVDPPYIATAAFAAAGYARLNRCNDPLTLSNPLCGTALTCLMAPEPQDRLTTDTMDQMLGAGLTIFGVNASGEVEITAFTSTYRQTDQGVEDGSFIDGQHVARLRAISSYVEERLKAVYGQHTIRADGYIPRPGQNVATVWQIRSFVQGFGFELSDSNLIESPEAWSEAVDVQWDGGNSCVNITVSPNLVNKLCCINLFVNSVI